MKDENKFRDIKWLSDLKLRLGWGMTGQQEGIGDYNYFDIYQTGNSTNGYYPVTGEGINCSPTSCKQGLDLGNNNNLQRWSWLGILNQRLSGSVDWYYRKTTDLLNTVIVPAGSNFRNQSSI